MSRGEVAERARFIEQCDVEPGDLAGIIVAVVIGWLRSSRPAIRAATVLLILAAITALPATVALMPQRQCPVASQPKLPRTAPASESQFASMSEPSNDENIMTRSPVLSTTNICADAVPAARRTAVKRRVTGLIIQLSALARRRSARKSLDDAAEY